jgi:chemotaxis protein histidine kinase CheA
MLRATMSKPNVQIINPREVAPRVLDIQKPVFDQTALVRADQTLKALSGSFDQWLEADVAQLQMARVKAEQDGWSDKALHGVFAASHNLKGMGATYGSPLATQLAASLCRLTETDAGKASARANPSLVSAHVDAVRAALRDNITSANHPVGRALLEALEAQVARLGVAPD